ncbi:MAG: Ig-like domain-containing protein [Culturomica sp.]|nr:Ig-like domain-containing protein [Culturomica sp.]
MNKHLSAALFCITACAAVLFTSCSKDDGPVSVTGITLNKTADTLFAGDTVRLIATVQPTTATDQSLTWSSSDTTKAVVNSSGLVTAKALGSAIITVKTNDGNKTDTCTVTVAERPISAAGALINGVYWAGCNVDAPATFAATPESAGMFYQWNRKKGWPSTGSITDWDASTPSGDTWEAANDPCPSGWRVPTSDELDALLATDKVINVWTTLNSVYGRKFTDKISGNSIFLPAAGYRDYYGDGSLLNAGSFGDYWSTSPNDSFNAWGLSFLSMDADRSSSSRSYGSSLRCVRAE